MLDASLIAAAWGVAGAVNYAAPKLSLCYYTAREAKGPWGRCLAEFPIALVVGAISAAAFSGWLAGFLHQTDGRAVAAMIGMIANTVSPAMIALVSDKFTKRFAA